jgi:hypothetical protein
MSWVRATIRRALDRVAFAIAARLDQRTNTTAEETIRVMLGCIAARQVLGHQRPKKLAEVEFRVYSQWGEDGIIQYLTSVVPCDPTFVEFGVQDYIESNTRFLVLKDNWSGLVLDGSDENVRRIREDRISWRHDLTSICAFIDRDNINGLIAQRFPGPELGLLSIDIDGNDYWIWEAMVQVRPAIVVCEYNSVFGARLPVTIPYRPDFDRTRAHYSNLYFGASLAALCHLAAKKGYAFVGSNSSGNNAFFVRLDRLSGLAPLPVQDGYVESSFRESRNTDGRLSYLTGIARLREIQELPLMNVETGAVLAIRELYADVLSAPH